MKILEDTIYTPKETQVYLKVSQSTMTRMLKSGLIRAAKVGKQYRIFGKEILRVISPEIEDKVGQVYNKARRWVHSGITEESSSNGGVAEKAMKIYVIIQARMNSKRLPGKVLKEANAKPLLGFLLDRVRRIRSVDGFAVATSSEISDDPIAHFCQANGYRCLRGQLDNVAKRFLDAADHYGLDGFVRVSGDSPFMDPTLIEEFVKTFRKGDFDLVTNVQPRTFPQGLSLEVVRTETYRRTYPKLKTPEEFEHVVPYMYHHPDQFRIRNIVNPEGDQSRIKLTVDTLEDWERFLSIRDQMERPFETYSWREIVQLYKRIVTEEKARS